MPRYLSLFSLLLFTYHCTAQIDSCHNAKLIIGEPILVDSFGLDSIRIDYSGCKNSYQPNHRWFKFEVYKSGDFNLTITSLEDGSDLDFGIYKVEDFNCDLLEWKNTNNPSGNLSTNVSNCKHTLREGGKTGMRKWDDDEYECPSCSEGDNGFVNSLNVEIGEKYYLIISNHSSNGGFMLDFCGTASINPNHDYLNQYCSEGSLKIKTFDDFNLNGNKEPYENYISDISFIVEDIYDTLYYTTSGLNENNSIDVNFGSYRVRLNADLHEDLIVTNDSIELNLNLSKESFSSTLEVGVYHVSDTLSGVASLFYTQPRCNEESELILHFNFYNPFEEKLAGIIWVENVKDYEIIAQNETIPDTIIENRIGWFVEIPVKKSEMGRNIKFKNPPFIDSLVQYHEFNVWLESPIPGFSDHRRFESSYKEELLCAYDPNDKLGHPLRPDNSLFRGEKLTYQIRFQNTGNDFARNVVILDTLSKLLKQSSFRFIKTSHPEHLNVTLNENILKFEFRNIMLPDSLSNFEGSQGYLKYQIIPQNGLKENVEIRNGAAIYFDQNAPIYTNTTHHILKDKSQNSRTQTSLSLEFFPNPFVDFIIYRLKGVNSSDNLKYSIFDSYGKLVERDFCEELGRIQFDDLRTGVYIIMFDDGESRVSKKLLKL